MRCAHLRTDWTDCTWTAAFPFDPATSLRCADQWTMYEGCCHNMAQLSHFHRQVSLLFFDSQAHSMSEQLRSGSLTSLTLKMYYELKFCKG